MTAEFSIQDWFETRHYMRANFLSRTGWSDATASPVGEDCAFRRYFRLEKNNKTAILMEAIPDGNDLATPGHNMGDFVKIAKALREAGLHTPEIYDLDTEGGYILLEDFGDTSFKMAMKNGADPKELYGLATDILVFIKDNIDPSGMDIPRYYDSHVHTARRRIIDWYLPALRQQQNPAGLAESYLDVWNDIEESLPPCPQGFLHIDYHVENLMWMPEKDDKDRCGILDFQGAMIGPAPYDLANLLEDARLDMPETLRAEMLSRFCEGMSKEDKEVFENWYRVLATQFHCRVAGQFIRLAVHDGKDRYLQHLPRVLQYLKQGMEHPVLAPLKDWCAEQEILFDQLPQINTNTKTFIGDDAF